MLLFGLRARHYMRAMIAAILTSIVVLFIGGGLAIIRNNVTNVAWFSWVFPNTHAVDPLRNQILFHAWPVDWTRTILILSAFATAGLLVCLPLAARQIRQLK